MRTLQLLWPPSPFHCIATRLRCGINGKEYGWVARGDRGRWPAPRIATMTRVRGESVPIEPSGGSYAHTRAGPRADRPRPGTGTFSYRIRERGTLLVVPVRGAAWQRHDRERWPFDG